jgi:hypothetical protein
MRYRRAFVRCVELTVCLLVIGMSFQRQAVGAIIPGQTDNFQDGTTQHWANGDGGSTGPFNIANGGPDGGGDKYLEILSGALGGSQKLIAFNRSQWTGNYLANGGVNEIDADLANFGPQPLFIRIAIRQTLGRTAPGYASTTPFMLPADGNWHQAAFFIDAADLTPINSGDFPSVPPAPLGTFLQSVAEFRILSSVSPSLMGDPIDGNLGVDNIQAVPGEPVVPEPSTFALVSAGLFALAAFGRGTMPTTSG